MWETYERTGWRQTCYRRGVQVILAPHWSHAADTELSLVTRGAILSSHWSGGILPRRESVREIRRVRSCGVTSVETMRRGGDAHLQKGEIFSLKCEKNISVNTSKVFE